ncbi:hypothetical protein PInf_020062 [Phytophthora infestans]|nr:hypothetical protein PInf_020062 [Phytophthora infestans]
MMLSSASFADRSKRDEEAELILRNVSGAEDVVDDCSARSAGRSAPRSELILRFGIGQNKSLKRSSQSIQEEATSELIWARRSPRRRSPLRTMRLVPRKVFSHPPIEYHHLERHESAVIRRQRSKSRRIWCAIIALTTGILGFIAVLAILRAVEDASHLAPTKRPVFPTQYEASVTFHMPYMDMVEPLYVHVDETKGLQKLSYYGGTDVYIYNTSGTSYQIIPVIRERKCFKSGSESLQHIFPNMTLFEPNTACS